MPCVSRFYGIAIYMYFNDHAPPHFHAIYGEYDAEIEIATGAVTGGAIPPKALKIVRQWRKEHRRELEENWRLARTERPLNPIAGLE